MLEICVLKENVYNEINIFKKSLIKLQIGVDINVN